jgi:flavin reductase (DIM6/NTAB) family NADH-FMN oxidoreductase RutF
MRRVALSKIHRLLYPAVPVVVAAARADGVSAMPVVSAVSLSSNPPLVGLSLSPSHATYGAIVKSGSFSVSWLDRRYTEEVEKLGSTSGANTKDKLSAAGLHYDLRGSPAVPLIRESSAYLACGLADVRSFGDHDLVVGAVRVARAIEDFSDYWSFRTYHPILYSGLGRRPPSHWRAVRRS